MDPDPVIRITLREIYDAVKVLTGEVRVLVTQHSSTQNDVRDHEDRIRVLERARWPLPSLAILLSLASAALAVVKFTTG